MDMSVQDRSIDYDDLDVQHYAVNTAFSENDSAVYRKGIEPAGGSLGRGEVAELLSIKYTLFLFSGSTENMHGRWQLGLDPTPAFNLGAFNYGSAVSGDDSYTFIDSQNGNVAGDTTSLGGNYVDDLENDVWVIEQPHQTTDTAEGWSGHMAHNHIDLKGMEGVEHGPLVDRHQNLWEVWNQSGDTAGTNVSLYRSVTLYWHVTDEEERL